MVTGTLKVKTVKGVDVTTRNLKAGKVGKSYSAAVKAARGTSPYTWELTAGSLPDGLGFDAATGVVSGVPTTAGTVVLTFEVTDSLGGKAEGDVSLTIR